MYILPSLLIPVILAIVVVEIIAAWKLFEKAGKPGWATIVPIYNVIVLLEIIHKPIWWIALLLIPVANIVILILIYIELSKVFGKSSGFAVGLFLLRPVFIMILGFGSAQYKGESNDGSEGEALDSMITEG